MKNLPLYAAARQSAPACSTEANSGLFFDRFFDAYSTDWSVAEGKEGTGKAAWLKPLAKGKTGCSDALRANALRQLALVEARGGVAATFQVSWHFATGLGLQHPVENGLLWHYTLGVPYLPGSSVKGMVRGWQEVWDGSEPGAVLQTFGTQDAAGDLLFFDAIPISAVELAVDVMTPHCGRWYERGGEAGTAPEAVPADWHDPVPVPFLVVKNATFLFSVAPRRDTQPKAAAAAIEAIAEALETLGAGAKTAAGYGRMLRDDRALDKLREALKEAQNQAAQKAKLKTLNPFERELQELVQRRPNQSEGEHTFLLNKLKAGAWEGLQKVEAARYIKLLMQKNGHWKETTTHLHPEKSDKDYMRTQIVLSFLKGEQP